MSEILNDITPEYHPVSLMRSMEKKAKDKKACAAFVVLLYDDCSLDYDGCGICSRDLLWALEKMKALVLEGETN